MQKRGNNLYRFVDNAPTEWVDPLGLALYAFDGTNNDGYRDSKTNEETNVFVLSKIYKGNAWWQDGRAHDVPFGMLPASYSNYVGTPHDSRWKNDKLVEFLTGRQRVRKVYYHP